MDQRLRKQYTNVYGPYVAGEHRIGDRVTAHSGSGTIIWSYKPQGESLTYVIDDDSGWPLEIHMNEVFS